MADRWTQFLQHPATLMGAGIMAGADPRGEGLGGVGTGIMAANRMLMEQQAAERQRQQAITGSYSKTPTYIQDEEGNIRMIQLGAGGDYRDVQLPAGFRPSVPLTMRDLGDVMAGIHPRTGRVEAEYPKALAPAQEPATQAAQQAAKTRARMETERRTEAQMDLPGQTMDAEMMNQYVEELVNHPGLGAATGLSSLAPIIPGSDRADFEERRRQILGGAFLQAYQQLKGGGQITEIEGQKAEQSLLRAGTATSQEDFVEAMKDFQGVILAALNRTRQSAGKEPLKKLPGATGGAQSNRQRTRRSKAARQEQRRRVDAIMRGEMP